MGGATRKSEEVTISNNQMIKKAEVEVMEAMERKEEEEVENTNRYAMMEAEGRKMDEDKVEEAEKREERKKTEVKGKEQWIQIRRQLKDKDKPHEGVCSE